MILKDKYRSNVIYDLTLRFLVATWNNYLIKIPDQEEDRRMK